MFRVSVLGFVFWAVAPLTAMGANVVYQNDFESAVGTEWSNTGLAVTPIGGRQFLGMLGAGATTLTLGGIPDGQAVNVAFDLFIINTWDGSQLVDPLSNPVHTVGPDVWSLFADGGAPLISTTFSVFDGTKPMHSFRNYPQAFPGNYPVDSFPARTGAVENDTLGYFEGDSVYHLAFDFIHTSGALRLDFSGTFPEGDPETWGLDNILVAVPEPSSVTLSVLASIALSLWALVSVRRPGKGPVTTCPNRRRPETGHNPFSV